ncbi:MAG: PQQ-binding-like beta-propeller repeat protein [Lachnospiraceae bacterium]|nr:PQQ-binding-like beta-propeller repeat protein [Lachnospiraceae bacterium]
MKQKKHLFFLCVVSAAILLCGWSSFREERGTGHANVVSAQSPIDIQKGGTIWSRSFSSGSATSYNSSPVLTGQALYVVNTNQLYELDLQGNITRQLTLSAPMNSVCHTLIEGDFLYVPLTGGFIQCIRISTMTSVWQSEVFGGQSLSTLYYHEGCLYAGTTNMVNASDTTGIFYCLDASDGSTLWTYEDTEHPGGYYWSGAVSYGDALYFAGDNGILISHNLRTDEVYDTRPLSDTAKIRAGLTYDADNDALYTVANDGTLYKITASKEGQIQSVTSAPVVPGASLVNCTSTPTIYNNRLYIGSIADTYGHLSILNADTLELHYTVQGRQYAEIKSSPLVSTGYATEENHQQVYVYVSCNALPGALYYLADNTEAVSGTLQTLFTPATARQFCLSSIVCGKDGTLYYSNDSGTLFAVRETDISSDRITPTPPDSPPVSAVTPSPSPTASSKPTAAPDGKETGKKPKAPVKVRCKKTKKTWILRWKKKTAESQTVVYIKRGSGKWEKTVVPKKSQLVIKGTDKKKARGSGGKKIQVRLRSRMRQNKKWRYSSYTRILKLR